ncbi:hypothetical protein [Niallia sp. 03133]|uniref:hypothetical protein n=1 Tax=Niallia sp. 03133 TaxID=3458060 RepID=UPI00404436EC
MKITKTYMVVCTMLVSLFDCMMIPVHKSEASPAPKAAITAADYHNNKNLTYPIVSTINNEVEKKINQVLTDHMKKSELAYYKLMKQMLEDKKKGLLQRLSL